jgi:hypothetical protein
MKPLFDKPRPNFIRKDQKLSDKNQVLYLCFLPNRFLVFKQFSIRYYYDDANYAAWKEYIEKEFKWWFKSRLMSNRTDETII